MLGPKSPELGHLPGNLARLRIDVEKRGLLTTNVILRLVVDFHAGQIMSPAVLISFGMTR
jgi:hypothetical protein